MRESSANGNVRLKAAIRSMKWIYVLDGCLVEFPNTQIGKYVIIHIRIRVLQNVHMHLNIKYPFMRIIQSSKSNTIIVSLFNTY